MTTVVDEHESTLVDVEYMILLTHYYGNYTLDKLQVGTTCDGRSMYYHYNWVPLA